MAKASSSTTSFGMIPIVAAIVGSQKDSFADGWRLIKTSNREPTSTVRFHANSQETLEDIKMAFIETLQEVREDLYFA